MPSIIRPARGALVAVALLAALVLGSAAPTAAFSMKGEVIRTKAVVAQPGMTAGGFVRCPTGHRVLAGGAYWYDAAGLADQWGILGASIPVRRGTGWYGSGTNFNQKPITLRIVIVCLRASTVGTTTTVRIDAAGTGGVAGGYLACPKGQRVVTGGVAWIVPGEPLTTPRGPLAHLVSSTPTVDGKGWYADGSSRLEVGGIERLRIVAVCGPAASVGVVSVRTKDRPPNSGDNSGAYLACPKGQRVMAGGAFIHPTGQGPDLDFSRYAMAKASTPTTDGKGWYARGDSPGGGLQTIVILCRPV
jgi:hypothetical protein